MIHEKWENETKYELIMIQKVTGRERIDYFFKRKVKRKSNMK